MKREPYCPAPFLRCCWENLPALMELNLLFLLTSLPVVTIPAALTALCRSCQYCLLGTGKPFRNYLNSFRSSLLSSLLPGLFFLTGIGGFLYGFLFYVQNSGTYPLLLFPAAFCLVTVYFLFCSGSVCFQMLSRVKLPFGGLLKNAAVLLFTRPRLMGGWLLLSTALLAAGLFLFPHSLPYLVLLGFSLPCMAGARGLLPVIENEIIEE